MGAGSSGPKHLDPINIYSNTPPEINTNNLIYNKEMFKGGGGGKIRINKKNNNNIYNTIANIIILLYFIVLFIFYNSKK